MSVETGAAAPDDGLSGLSLERIRAEQNFPLAIVAGLAAAAIGAAAWAAVTVATNMELGLMAIAVGFIVGQAIRVTGKGVDMKFGILGAFCGALGCASGTMLSGIVFFAQAKSLSIGQTVAVLNPELVMALAKAMFDPMDALFIGIGIYEGYKFSFKYHIAKGAA